MKRAFFIFCLLFYSANLANAWWWSDEPEAKRIDLYFGEALFQAYQENWFAAISRLDAELAQHYHLDEPQLDSLFGQLADAEFSVGDFELAYRMHQRAGRAISALINGEVDEQTRNAALFRLARIYFYKNQPLEALHALGQLTGRRSRELELNVAELRAQLLIVTGDFAAAVELLDTLQGKDTFGDYAGYNLAIALLREGRVEDALHQFNRVGQKAVDSGEALVIRDKANLVLGDRLLGAERYPFAKAVMDRVSLEGPFSNQALLGSGWADALQDDYERALVPWTLLSQRDVTDRSVQEALLAVPYAYGKLGVYSRSALFYGKALQVFAAEIDKLSASIISIREGRFLDALLREELQVDSSWIIRLRELPQSPETYYLLELLASHAFQEGLKNYLDLDALRDRLSGWRSDLDAYEEIIASRRAYYEPLLPEIDSQFRLLDSQMRLRLEQRDHIEQRLNGLLTAPRPELLMTAAERIAKERLYQLQIKPAVTEDDLQRVRRLNGVIDWQIRLEYDQRQTDAFEHLFALNEHIVALQQRYQSFVRIRQAATQSYQGFDETIRLQRIRIDAAGTAIDRLMKRQGHQLEELAIAELQERRDRLEEFQVKARFAMADSFDRAARKGEESAEPGEEKEQ